MIAWVAARSDGDQLRPGPRLPVPAGHVGPRARTRSRRRSAPTRSSARRSRSGTSPAARWSAGNLLVVPDPGQHHLPAAGLPAVDDQRVPHVPADHRRDHEPDRPGRTRSPRRCGSCSPAARRPSPSPGPTPSPGASPGPSASPGADRRARRRRRRSGTFRRRRPATSPGWSRTRTSTSRPRRRRFAPATSRATARRSPRCRRRCRLLGALVGPSPSP